MDVLKRNLPSYQVLDICVMSWLKIYKHTYTQLHPTRIPTLPHTRLMETLLKIRRIDVTGVYLATVSAIPLTFSYTNVANPGKKLGDDVHFL